MNSFRKALISWYRRNRRDLPWRRTKDPYRVWISEVMLQQTTVEAVIPYFKRFLRRFPDVSSLARAQEETVLSLWSGLGYYSRARNLHRAARMILRSGGARRTFCLRLPQRKSFPKRQDPTVANDIVEELQKLPGIGRYTAGAIASIAFGQRAPVLDGNVIRVLSRLFAMSDDPKTSRGRERFWNRAEEVLPAKNCGNFNQALMELGATVCLPTAPQCKKCPVRDFCAARRQGSPEAYPRARRKVFYHEVRMTAAVVLRQGKILMVQRPRNGLLKGMWEFPMVEGGQGRLVQKWPVQVLSELPSLRHSVLNRRLKIHPLVCRLKEGMPHGLPHRWVLPSQLSSLPSSSMNRKIVQILVSFRGRP